MARIETYVEDSQVTENDIVIGSDGDNFNQTKNFKVSAILGLLELEAQNIIPNVTTTIVDVDTTIEDALSTINLTVSTNESPVLLIFLKDEIDEATSETVTRKYIYLFQEGMGTYNPVSDTISIDDLILLNVANPTITDVDGLDNTTIIDLGDVTGSDFITEINDTNPSFDLSDSNETYFFSYEDNGSLFLQKFIGTNGFYGLNDNTAVAGDFISFSDTSFDDDNVKAKYVSITLNSDNFANESLEIDDVVRAVNALKPNVTITDKELFIAYSDTLANDASTNYRSVYIINTGKGTYGRDATQIVNSNVLKIRGEQINENLSSYTNDGDFATETYVNNADNLKLNKAGDTMTGDLAMGANKVTSSATPSTDNDLTNKAYVDSLDRFRGNYSSSATIQALTDNVEGDYATLSNGNVEQLWVYQNSNWVLISAKPYYVEITANTTLTNDYHNATINVGSTGNFNLVFPDSLINGFEVNIRNFSGGTLNFTTTGTATVSESSLFTGNLATAIGDGSDFVIDTTESENYDRIRMGIYDYEDTQSAVTLVANTWTELSNNGAGSNSFTNPITGVDNIYNVATDRFDFSGLNIGDTVTIRLDLELTTSGANNVVDCRLVLGEGQAGEYSLKFFSSKYFKTSGTYQIQETLPIYIGNNLTKDNPAFIEFRSDDTDDINMNGFYVKVLAIV